MSPCQGECRGFEPRISLIMKNITELQPDEVFVFGSNEAGAHGAGAALRALDFGAIVGQGYGPQGKAFAIPTKNGWIRTLPVEEIGKYVTRFIEYAKERPETKFLVTPIGCGLAGYKFEDIAPLFKDALGISNIILPEEFINILV